MNKTFLITAAIIGALSVALGAFGAHGLKDKLNEYTLGIFETAVRYQFYHVFALLTVGLLFQSYNNGWMLWSGRLFIASNNESMKWLGAVTPFGGLCFIAGWVCIAIGIVKS